MKAINFKESTIELKKPKSMTDDECSSLFIHQSDTGECISGWITDYKIIGEKIKYKHFKKQEKSKKQECYKGHGLCDCTGLCRENC